MAASVQLEGDDCLAVGFPYDAALVEQVKSRLAQRRWDPERKRWIVHLAELPLLAEILSLDSRSLPPEVRRAYDERWRSGEAEIRLGPVFSRLAGRDLPLDALEDAASFPVQGARFHPSYASGEWDGLRRLLRRDAGVVFPTGLVPRVRAVLARQGRAVRLVEERPVPPPAALRAPGGPAPRPYQREALDAARAAERGVLQLATGAGKTLVAAHLIAQRAVPAVVFVHTRELLHQTARVLAQTLGEPIGLVGDGRVAPRRTTVATIQTAAGALGLRCAPADAEDGLEADDTDIEREGRRELVRQTLADADLVIFDECHHLPADTCYDLAQTLERPYFRYGLSATPYRADGADLLLEAALGPVIVRIDSSRLIREGHLVPPRIVFLDVPPPPVDLADLPYARLYERAVVHHDARNRLLAEAARREWQDGRSVLVLVSQVEHGKRLHDLLPEAEFLTGSDPSERRGGALERFRARDLRLLIATTLADEGLDLPTLDVLVLAGGGRSETRALQRIGRALRPAQGKQRATVYDCWDQARYLCDHSRRRRRIYETEPLFEIVMTGDTRGEARQGRLF